MRNYGLFLITGNARFMSSNSLNSYIPEPESRQPPGAREPTTLYPKAPNSQRLQYHLMRLGPRGSYSDSLFPTL